MPSTYKHNLPDYSNYGHDTTSFNNASLKTDFKYSE